MKLSEYYLQFDTMQAMSWNNSNENQLDVVLEFEVSISAIEAKKIRFCCSFCWYCIASGNRPLFEFSNTAFSNH